MLNSRQHLTYFAHTNYRNSTQLFGIKQEDRLLHTYIIGKTGTGKTNLLQTKILQDIETGRGLCVFDVHGDIIIISQIPENSRKNIIKLT